jgi:hypothetical protein
LKSFLPVLLILTACSVSDSPPGDEQGRLANKETESLVEAPSDAARALGADELVRNTYNVAHGVCGHRPEDVYEKAGTRSIHEAADWYSLGSTEGAHRAASYRGCADALMGKTKNF